MKTRAMILMFVVLTPVIAALAADAGAAGGAGAGGEAVRVGMLEAFFVQRHPVSRRIEWLGSFIIWVLLALSAFCVAFLVMRMQENRRRDILSPELEKRARERAGAGLPGEVIQLASAERTFFARVLRDTVEHHAHGHGAMVRALEQASESRAYQRLRSIEPLNVVGNVAPMIGLFGTVYGMILAFRQIVLGGGSPDPVALANGIGTALVTTFWGLVVAIPALSGYALLRNKIDGLTSEATRGVDEIVAILRERGAGRP